MDPSWSDHLLRQEATKELISEITSTGLVETAADLSCGDAFFANHFTSLVWWLGDFAPGYDYEGPIEETIFQIPHVDLFLLCETLEHLDEPQLVLQRIRRQADRLILTTPLMTQYDENPQHYWCWDDEAVLQLILAAGWTVERLIVTEPQVGYRFQCWSLS